MLALLSLTGKRWLLPTIDAPGGDIATLVRQLALQRGLHGAPKTASWTRTANVRTAAARIRKALGQQEHVGIFSDYDCDGIGATAELVRYFRRNGTDPHVRLPHRVQDGYGLNVRIVDELKDAGITLLITADTGIASALEIAALNERGIDTIVTDHHAVPAHIPPAVAIVHPSLMPDIPLPHPSGAGVAFRLIEALEGGMWEDRDTDIALAMVGTIADLVPLKGGNRLLVQQGLLALAGLDDGAPLARLASIAGLRRDRVTSTDIAFRIAPRINASGRMDDPRIALDALLGNVDAITELDTLNRERQKETEALVQTARESLEINSDGTSVLPPLVALADAEFPHGLIGLIAGKLTEETGRPSMVATVDGDTCIASLRSPPCYNVTEGLTRSRALLERFGGHAQAAGCTVRLENWETLCHALESDVQSRTSATDLQPTLTIDAELTLQDVTLDLLRALRHLEPYGQENPEPHFLLRNVSLDLPRCIGRERNHLQCRIHGRKAVGFRLGHLLHRCSGQLDIACRIALDEWNGYAQPQIVIEDIRVAERVHAQKN